MNDSERRLIRFVCDGDMRNAQKAVKIILNSISSKKDEQFKEWRDDEGRTHNITYWVPLPEHPVKY